MDLVLNLVRLPEPARPGIVTAPVLVPDQFGSSKNSRVVLVCRNIGVLHRTGEDHGAYAGGDPESGLAQPERAAGGCVFLLAVKVVTANRGKRTFARLRAGEPACSRFFNDQPVQKLFLLHLLEALFQAVPDALPGGTRGSRLDVIVQ